MSEGTENNTVKGGGRGRTVLVGLAAGLLVAAALVYTLMPGMMLVGLAAGLAAGLLMAAALVYTLMPGMMIVTHPSPKGFDATVAALGESIEAQGWVHSETKSMNKSLAKQGVDFGPKVALISLCHPDYAQSVLKTDRFVSSLMPCKISVWEGDDGRVYVSKMNTGLMGKLFGGNIAAVMGGRVGPDERAILSRALVE